MKSKAFVLGMLISMSCVAAHAGPRYVPMSHAPLVVKAGQDIFTSNTSGAFRDKGAACDHVLLMNKMMCASRNYFNTTSVKCECEEESGGTWSCVAITICQD